MLSTALLLLRSSLFLSLHLSGNASSFQATERGRGAGLSGAVRPGGLGGAERAGGTEYAAGGAYY